MCLEDLRLGRGRFFKDPAVTNGQVFQFLTPDPTRVAILLSFSGVNTFDSTGAPVNLDTLTITAGVNASGQRISIVCGVSIITVLRIEDLGELITGPITVTVNNASGIAAVIMVPICTAINAPPLDTYKP